MRPRAGEAVEQPNLDPNDGLADVVADAGRRVHAILPNPDPII
jgi:hypothetical protein